MFTKLIVKACMSSYVHKLTFYYLSLLKFARYLLYINFLFCFMLLFYGELRQIYNITNYVFNFTMEVIAYVRRFVCLSTNWLTRKIFQRLSRNLVQLIMYLPTLIH